MGQPQRSQAGSIYRAMAGGCKKVTAFYTEADRLVITQERDERFYAKKGKYTIRFTGDSILIRTDVTNKKNLIF